MRSYYEILAVINSALNVIHRIRKIRKIPNSQYLDDFQESLYIFKEQFLYQDRKINGTRRQSVEKNVRSFSA